MSKQLTDKARDALAGAASGVPSSIHEWFRPEWLKAEWECCKHCGIVRRMDGVANKPCHGPVSVGPR